MRRREEPILFCFCAPAASGKSTICHQLIESDPALKLSISTTTRSPRHNEKDSLHYYFVDDEEFEKRVKQDSFIEHAVFGSNRYGTERVNLEQARNEEADLLLDIDVQGARQLKKLYPQSVVTIFVFPPSFDVLVERFEKRGTDTEEQRQKRLEIAEEEIAILRSDDFSDYLLINDKLDESIAEGRAIICAARQKYKRASETYLDSLFSR